MWNGLHPSTVPGASFDKRGFKAESWGNSAAPGVRGCCTALELIESPALLTPSVDLGIVEVCASRGLAQAPREAGGLALAASPASNEVDDEEELELSEEREPL